MVAVLAVLLVGVLGILAIRSTNWADNTHIENISHIKVGMDSMQVLKIMGTPTNRRKVDRQIYFEYEIPSSYSIQPQIVFDSIGRVVYVNPPNQ